jgi:hypothetical protein
VAATPSVRQPHSAPQYGCKTLDALPTTAGPDSKSHGFDLVMCDVLQMTRFFGPQSNTWRTPRAVQVTYPYPCQSLKSRSPPNAGHSPPVNPACLNKKCASALSFDRLDSKPSDSLPLHVTHCYILESLPFCSFCEPRLPTQPIQNISSGQPTNNIDRPSFRA